MQKLLGSKNIYLDIDGTSQSDRILKALDPEYFKVDEKTIKDFTVFAIRFSRLINFYNLDNRVDGDWSNFIENDLTFVLVQIRGYDLKLEKNKYSKSISSLISAHNFKEAITCFKEALKTTTSNFARIEAWRNKTKQIPDFNLELIKIISSKLNTLLTQTYLIEKYLIDNKTLDKTTVDYFNLFFNVWQINLSYKKEFNLENVSELNRLKHLGKHLDQLFYELMAQMEQIIESADNYFKKNIENEGKVSPSIALFLTFLDLYKEAQNNINQITKRHLDLYYRDYLKFSEQDPKPDKVHIVFELADNVKEYEIKKGTLLTAGKDENDNELFYETDRTIVVNKARTEALKVVLLDQSIKKPETTIHEKIATETFHLITHPDLDVLSQINRETEIIIDKKEIGFAISHHILLQEDGYRKIRFLFTFSKHHFFEMLQKLRNLIPQFDIPELELSEDELYSNLLDDLFQISYSTDEGNWYKLEDSEAEVHIIKDKEGKYESQLEILILIPAASPKVAAYKGSQYSDAESKNIPVFKFVLNPLKGFLYESFNRLYVNRIDIDVEVLNSKNIFVQNDFGLIDINAPFEPFGPIPNIGSSLLIGHKNLFFNKVNDIKINLSWYNLPNNEGGFQEYYKGYDYISGNDTFKVKMTHLKNRRWIPTSNTQVFDLFTNAHDENDNEIEAVSEVRRINEIDLNLLQINDFIPEFEEIKDYNAFTNNGFLKMELCFPPNAFGHREYPELLKKSYLVKNKKGEIFTPSEPYAPQLKSISIDYATSTTIKLGKKSDTDQSLYYHIYPFGIKNVNEDLKSNRESILPNFKSGAYLYIGINNFEGAGRLNVFFQLDGSLSIDQRKNHEVRWYVVNNNAISRISDDEILNDHTNQLKTSGIIEFNLEKKVKNKSGILGDNQLFWLVCYNNMGINFIENIIDLNLQAVTATLKLNGSDPEHLQSYLPANTINDFKEVKPAIQAVKQPYSSFGGRKKEHESDFYTRVSERLRHKAKAINIWDIETQILENFRIINRVKVLGHINLDLKPSPGSVLIVLIPYNLGVSSKNKLEPRVSLEKLIEIKEFIAERSSSFSDIIVSNPNYEKVKVKLNVKFKKGYDVGYYLRKLNQEIKEFLSPWLFNEMQQVNFGESIHGSYILNFIEKREYVDFVTNFVLFHIVNNEIINHNQSIRTNVKVTPTTPTSVLVSDDQHIIDALDEQFFTDNNGINDMMLEMDFMVENDNNENFEANRFLGQLTSGKMLSNKPQKGAPEKKNYTIKINL